MEYRCVECGYKMGKNKHLFIQYSPGNIRLFKCVKCNLVADQYIECEIMILLIDLILHKPKAYRHLLYNLLNQQLVNNQVALGTVLEIFISIYPPGWLILISDWSEENWDMQINFSSVFWRCGKMLTDLLIGNIIFLCCLVYLTRFFCNPTTKVSRIKDILLSIFISSYFKIFLIAMMVWEFPSSVFFITDMFVLSSNTVALKVMTEASIEKCIGACLSAHVVKFMFRWILNIITNPSLLYNQNICWKNLVSGVLGDQYLELGHLSPT